MTAFKQHRAFFVLLCFAALVFMADIWAYREFVRAESYFGLGARLMIDHGDWLTPHAPDELPLNKPPLTYWLIGVAYKLFGANYGSARLPSVMAALATIVVVYAFGNSIGGRRNGLVAAAMLATSYLFMNFARMAMSDMLLTFFVTASLSSFALVLIGPKQISSRFAYLGYAALALGVLTKGPVALAIVLPPIAIELIIGRKREDLARLRVVRGLILLVLIAAPYFLLVYRRAGAGPLQFFFVGENLRRFTGAMYGSSARPFWYEFAAFFSDFAPWSLLLPIAFAVDWKRRRDLPTARAARILYLWLGTGILLFSFSSFKLDYYLLPLMPASALIIARLVSERSKASNGVTWLLKGFFLLCAVVMLLVAFWSLEVARELSVNGAIRLLPVLVAATGAAVIIYFVIRQTSFTAAIGLSVLIGVLMLSFELTFLPAFRRFLPAPELVAALPSDRLWFTSRLANDWANDLEFNLPAGRSVTRLNASDETTFAQALTQPKTVILIRESEYFDLLRRDPQMKILAQAATYGHGAPGFRMLRNPRRERLLVIGH